MGNGYLENGIWGQESRQEHGDFRVLQILCPPDLSFAPSETDHSAIHEGTSTYSWHKQLLFPQVILGQFFRSRLSFNIISAEMLLLLAGPFFVEMLLQIILGFFDCILWLLQVLPCNLKCHVFFWVLRYC